MMCATTIKGRIQKWLSVEFRISQKTLQISYTMFSLECISPSFYHVKGCGLEIIGI
jgi:hypothetical protein